MFTGIVEEIGFVESIEKSGDGARIKIRAKKVLEDSKRGDSISTNGVCLTVTDFWSDGYYSDVMAETMRRSNLGECKTGSKVNLERALKASDRLGGHIVSGHIDGVGIITSNEKESNAVWVTIKAPKEILKYIVEKGSIAIDGISLTVAYVDNEVFKVSIIPHTGEETTLLNKKKGHYVNLECDVIGKYVEKLLGINKGKEEKKKSSISMEFLMENGF
ncbi:riboflavin synthase [Clostridium sp. 'White wine YQ']|uniref:riboflavin synthase n=1 Tax=Clostridium sp. 'White wine YQ' TaxID=3027474 RepID=UPI0023673AF5|nr:riboflavin synthase [Clostridium sp. 'White wine YQ']MDD7795221.1 riboflavin synthase [Clostridium sp. 'White wine YQ']